MKQEKQLPYVCLYRDYLEAFRELSTQAVGRLVMAMLVYLETGEEPQLKGCERILWPGLRDKMLRDQNAYAMRCERNRINGSMGGKQKQRNLERSELPIGSAGCASQTDLANKNENENENNNKNKNENKNENKNDNKNENKNENETERNTGEYIAAAPLRPRFHKPSLEELQAYCRENNYPIDPGAVWDYYEANGWKVGKNPMKDWKAAVRNWMRKETEHGRPHKPAAADTIIFKNGHSL